MRFLVMVAYEASAWAEASPETRRSYFDAHHAFEQAAIERGTLVAGEALLPAGTATTLRHDGTGFVATEGPFAETAEQVGGIYLVDLPDLATAVEIGALLPPTYAVEIRAVLQIDGFESSPRETDGPARVGSTGGPA